MTTGPVTTGPVIGLCRDCATPETGADGTAATGWVGSERT